MQSVLLLIGLLVTGLLMFSAGYLLQVSSNKLWVKRSLLLFTLLYGAQMALLVGQLAGLVALQPLRLLLAFTLPSIGYFSFVLSVREQAQPRWRDSWLALPWLWLVALWWWPRVAAWLDLAIIANELLFAGLILRLALTMVAKELALWRKLALAFAGLFAVLAGFDVAIYWELTGPSLLTDSVALLLALWLVTAFWLVTLLLFVRHPKLIEFIDVHVAKTTELVNQVLPSALRHSLDAAQAQAIAEQVQQRLREQQLYLAEDCSLASVAKSLAMPARQVSAAVNSHCGKGFATLLNDFRVEHAAALLADQQFAALPIISLMYESGFRTKSSFNKEFNQRLGMSPSQYRQKMLPESAE